ncbi:phosphopantetheine adenylyltransferase [Bacillus horti]|uniref:Phosphopantetheine adenylyltransferase n=1 Tax=Caldalkalibacillus horti TaxID=77523 RepID=A0ABT9W1M4_9BACI|nr:phosphopantetheine adenylyltransferase [Bacillus horti]MDQ0167155.1 hypothetical protein [Bacillus horti]
MKAIISGLFIIVGIIHMLPVIGVLGADRLTALYGIPVQETNLVILMRHRAVLFGLLGLFLVYAAFKPALQPLALIGGFISVASFILIAYSAGGFNSEIKTVVLVDIVALVCLVLAFALRFVVRD